jgi:glutamine amidotransferase
VNVAIVDNGGANLASLSFAFRRLGIRPRLTSDAARIAQADRVVLPGVGAAGAAMERLTALGLVSVILSLTQPVLGVCLGMQLLFRHSEEDDTPCLGLMRETVRRLSPRSGLPVPHMGWNTLRAISPDPLLQGISDGDYVYFVHRYAAPVGEETLAASDYGTPLSAIVRRGNFWGTQFHPERSGPTGSRVLENFLRLTAPCC